MPFTLGALISVLQWVLPLIKLGVASLTKSNLPQELIDAGEAALVSLQKFINVAEPSRAQVLSLEIDPSAWGVPPPAPTTKVAK